MAYRAIQDDVAYSGSLAALSAEAERLYWRMLAHSDPWGRIEGSAYKLKAKCLPLVENVTSEAVNSWLDELVAVNRVYVYEHNGKFFAQLVDFDEKQPLDWIRKRGASRYPDPGEIPAKAKDGEGRPMPEKAGDGRSTPENSRIEVEVEIEKLGTIVPLGKSDVQDVYDHWRTERGKRDRRYDRISDARRKKIEARLREFTSVELKRAISAVALDPWDQRPRHDDLTVLLRSREQVYRFLELAEKPAPARKGGLTADDILSRVVATDPHDDEWKRRMEAAS